MCVCVSVYACVWSEVEKLSTVGQLTSISSVNHISRALLEQRKGIPNYPMIRLCTAPDRRAQLCSTHWCHTAALQMCLSHTPMSFSHPLFLSWSRYAQASSWTGHSQFLLPFPWGSWTDDPSSGMVSAHMAKWLQLSERFFVDNRETNGFECSSADQVVLELFV